MRIQGAALATARGIVRPFGSGDQGTPSTRGLGALLTTDWCPILRKQTVEIFRDGLQQPDTTTEAVVLLMEIPSCLP